MRKIRFFATSFKSGAGKMSSVSFFMINASKQDLEFRIQEGSEGGWTRIVDTSLSSPDDFPELGDEMILKKLICMVKARSLVILIR